MTGHFDPSIIESWLRARSVVREIPQPVEDANCLRVDTGLAGERARYVFGRGLEGMAGLANSITEPQVFLKFCGPAAPMRALLPDRWLMQSDRYVMTCDQDFAVGPPLPADFTMQLSRDGLVGRAVCVGPDGALAASGRCGEYAGAFIYDQIVTEPAHQRKGLGRAIMTALLSLKRDADTRQILVATAEGRALYSRLGWTVRSPYSTAVIPDSSQTQKQP